MIGIKCKSGHVFCACNSDYTDAEWRLQEAYYKAQGCTVEEHDEIRFSENEGCVDCGSLEHEFEKLIEQIKSEQL